MELIDFKKYELLNRLREKMGASEFGHYELFDPDRHASWQEKQGLNQGMLQADAHYLKEQQNQLLYKNLKVVALDSQTVHFSYCDHLKKLSTKGQLSSISITSSADQINNHSACQYCLHKLDYKGFDVYRQRHQAHNEKVLKEFSLFDYLNQYLNN
ncbi:hypothetical protein HF888_12545 [Bermanella marisrubri]|uniref:Uncharacterized protein n=1 Tax=Bermanella marisrubri TaxID=207949 RepID=Q1N026_9GAMM|nr:hypothetical protein [Bermanella marisrubri]EAT11537.1 hypothetical protein RED65_02664 [Oceanobacter sp. RED65] [Bermanella marisrubri]QIZ84998.1 hypothetical protein HF888_12545 [Bermanella marisrubri]